MANHAALNILVLHDNKPGHYNQSDGVVAALARRRAVNVERLEVPDGGLLPARPMRSLASAGSYPLALTERLAGTAGLKPLVKPDVIVSAGGKTLVANIILTRRYSAINIFSGSIRSVPAQSFSAILHVDPGLQHKPPYIVGLKPSAIEPPDRSRKTSSIKKLGLMVGGPTKTHLFTEEEFNALVAGLRRSTFDWQIMTSRRTPAEWADRLAGAAHERDFEMLDYRQTGAGGVAEMLAEIDCAVITDDSVSMISEAIAARLPVISLTAGETGKLSDQHYLDLLQQRRWYCPLPISHLSDDAAVTSAKFCSPMTENHVDVLAQRLFAQIPELLR